MIWTVLICWFLLSIPVGLLLGRIIYWGTHD